jgi:hypothetical protein
MDRRTFLASSLAAAGMSAAAADAAATGQTSPREPAGREHYELRRYDLRIGPNVGRLTEYVREVGIPALTRAGAGPVGLFNVMLGSDSPSLYVLIPYPSLAAFAGVRQALAEDQAYQQAAVPYRASAPSDPLYVRRESWLLRAFDGMPRLEVPPGARDGQPRIFELRTYESHSEAAGRKKVEMFDVGEIAIFRKTGLTPVFFGQTVIGAGAPSLTYMLTFPDAETRQRNWATFVADPDWKKLSTTPGYTDPEIVSKIHAKLLRPAQGSEI